VIIAQETMMMNLQRRRTIAIKAYIEKPMLHKCCYCNKVKNKHGDYIDIKDMPIEELSGYGRVTHGACKPCAKKELQKYYDSKK